MIFNSIEFAIFLPIVFGLYWFVTNKNLKFQNILLVGASYLFYGWWDYRFLALIAFSSILDYYIGLKLGEEKKQKNRKLLLVTSLVVNQNHTCRNSSIKNPVFIRYCFKNVQIGNVKNSFNLPLLGFRTDSFDF